MRSRLCGRLGELGSLGGLSRLAVTLGGLALALAATAGHHEAGAPSSPHHHPASVTQMISAVIGGKNVYVPSTVVVAAGQPHTLSVFNTTDKPHGFAIDALGILAVLPDGVEHEVKLPALEAGIYKIHCQLHGAHRSATLLVVDD